MADVVEVAHAIRRAGVRYTAIALNLRGYERAIQTLLDITGSLSKYRKGAYA